MAEKQGAIEFDMSREHVDAIQKIAGDRKVRISGAVKDGKFVVDAVSFANDQFSKAAFVPVNAPFKTARAAAAA